MRLVAHSAAAVGLLVLALVGGGAGAVWLASHAGEPGLPREPAAVTRADLQELSDELGRPVFWLGPRPGRTLELSRTQAGRVFVRYLPAGTPVGEDGASYPTVATYPVANAYGVAVVGAQRSGGIVSALPREAALITYVSRPRSAYYVQRGVRAQVEVFDPRPGRAAALIRSGAVVRLAPK